MGGGDSGCGCCGYGGGRVGFAVFFFFCDVGYWWLAVGVWMWVLLD